LIPGIVKLWESPGRAGGLPGEIILISIKSLLNLNYRGICIYKRIGSVFDLYFSGRESFF